MWKLLPFLLCFSANLTAQDLYDESVVRDIYLDFAQPNWWQLLDQNRLAETYIEADMTVDGVLYAQVGVRFKGNSSASVWPAEKMPFKVKTDEYVAGQDLYGFDTLNLGNSFKDPTFCREVVTYHILRNWMPAPRSNFVRLWLNNDYWGVYVNTEQVSGEFLEANYGEKAGNRYKAEPGPGTPPNGSALIWLGPDPAQYYAPYELKSDPTGTEWTDLVNMIDVLNNRPASVHEAELSPLLNIDRAQWYLVGLNLFGNLDSYLGLRGHNYYLYGQSDGRLDILTWDTNESFGNYRNGLSIPDIQTLSPLYKEGDPGRPLVGHMLYQGRRYGREVYMAHYRAMLSTEWNWARIGGLVAQYQALIEADVIADTKKLYSTPDFYNNVTANVSLSGHFTATGLQPFVETREAHLLADPDIAATCPTVTVLTTQPTNISSTDDVTILATVGGTPIDTVELRWKTTGLYVIEKMYDDGLHGDGGANDGTWGATIPAQPGGTKVEFYVLAESTAQRVTIDPLQAEFAPFEYTVDLNPIGSAVYLNEFVAKNNTGIVDEAGEYEDWIELYNELASPLDIGGAFLSDDATNLDKWDIPLGTTIDPHGTLLVWADEDGSQGPLHANFKLSAGGEEIYLVDTDGVTILDQISFGSQVADIATGRLFDATGDWVTFTSPTPDTSNEVSCGWRSYDQLDAAAHAMLLVGSGSPSLGGTADATLSGAAPGDRGAFYVSFAAAHVSGLTPAGVALVEVGLLFQTLPFQADGSGSVAVSVPLASPALVGLPLYIQAYVPSAGSEKLSNAVELTVCP